MWCTADPTREERHGQVGIHQWFSRWSRLAPCCREWTRGSWFSGQRAATQESHATELESGSRRHRAPHGQYEQSQKDQGVGKPTTHMSRQTFNGEEKAAHSSHFPFPLTSATETVKHDVTREASLPFLLPRDKHGVKVHSHLGRKFSAAGSTRGAPRASSHSFWCVHTSTRSAHTPVFQQDGCG